MSAVAFIAVCTARPRPAIHSGRKGGSQWWARDVYHLRNPFDAELTLCGRDCSEWLVMGEMTVINHHCCKRCANESLPK